MKSNLFCCGMDLRPVQEASQHVLRERFCSFGRHCIHVFGKESVRLLPSSETLQKTS